MIVALSLYHGPVLGTQANPLGLNHLCKSPGLWFIHQLNFRFFIDLSRTELAPSQTGNLVGGTLPIFGVSRFSLQPAHATVRP
jgi:hypothetical protein